MTESHSLLHDCLDALIDAGPDWAPSAVVWAELPALLASPEVARTLVARVAGLDWLPDDDDSAARRLLECLLDAARRADEDGQSEGASFLEEAARTCSVCVNGDATGAGLVGLSLSYRRAGLSTPEAVQNAQRPAEIEGDSEADTDSAIADLSVALGGMVEEAEDDLLPVYNRISESMAGMPDAACRALLDELGGWDDDRFARLCAYWVLDPRPGLAQAAAEVLAERASGGRLDSDTAGRLAWLRPLLPDGALARSVESALEAYRKRQRRWPALATTTNRARGYASLVDGAGAQYLAVADTDRRGARCALVLIKARYGVRDAYVLDQLELAEERDLWDTLYRSFDIGPVALSTVEALVGAAVAEGQARGETPPPGLIDVAIAAGLDELHPSALAGRSWLAHIAAAEGLDQLTPQKRGRLINQSAQWSDRLKAPATWFEDNDDVREVVLRYPGVDQRRRRLRRYLDGRRARWAEVLLRCALVLDSGPTTDLAASMAATAQALLDGREIRRIPVMEHVVEATLDAWVGDTSTDYEGTAPAIEPAIASDEGPVEGFPPLVTYCEDKRSLLQPLFDHGKGGQVWPAGYYGVHGFIFAIATHPDLIPPSAWLEPLLGDLDGDGVAFASKREAESVTDGLLAIFGAIMKHLQRDQAALPEGVKASVEANMNADPGGAVELSPDAPICQWAHGCCIAIDTFGHLEDPARANFGEDSEIAAEVDLSHTMVRVLADPQHFAQLMGQAYELTTPGQVVAAALDGLERYLGVLVRLANAYHESDAADAVDTTPEPRAAAAPTQTARATPPEPGEVVGGSKPQPARSQKVGRNEPCPCGSGRKYKRCCGNTARA